MARLWQGGHRGECQSCQGSRDESGERVCICAVQGTLLLPIRAFFQLLAVLPPLEHNVLTKIGSQRRRARPALQQSEIPPHAAAAPPCHACQSRHENGVAPRNPLPSVPMLVLSPREQVTTRPSLRPKLFPLLDGRANYLGRRVLRDFDEEMWILPLKEELRWESRHRKRWFLRATGLVGVKDGVVWGRKGRESRRRGVAGGALRLRLRGVRRVDGGC